MTVSSKRLGRVAFSSLMRSRRRRVQVNGRDAVLLIKAVADEVGKVLCGAPAFLLDLDRLVPLGVEVLYALVEADAEVVGREPQHLANRRRDACRV